MKKKSLHYWIQVLAVAVVTVVLVLDLDLVLDHDLLPVDPHVIHPSPLKNFLDKTRHDSFPRMQHVVGMMFQIKIGRHGSEDSVMMMVLTRPNTKMPCTLMVI
jgi:hypothetical protein